MPNNKSTSCPGYRQSINTGTSMRSRSASKLVLQCMQQTRRIERRVRQFQQRSLSSGRPVEADKRRRKRRHVCMCMSSVCSCFVLVAVSPCFWLRVVSYKSVVESTTANVKQGIDLETLEIYSPIRSILKGTTIIWTGQGGRGKGVFRKKSTRTSIMPQHLASRVDRQTDRRSVVASSTWASSLAVYTPVGSLHSCIFFSLLSRGAALEMVVM